MSRCPSPRIILYTRPIHDRTPDLDFMTVEADESDPKDNQILF